jgi:RNA polymerase sigma factor (sigma-70 family)
MLLDEDLPVASEARDDRILLCSEILEGLEEVDEKLARVVEMRFFAGMTLDEIATDLSISVSMVSKHWAAAKAWIKREIQRRGEEQF